MIININSILKWIADHLPGCAQVRSERMTVNEWRPTSSGINFAFASLSLSLSIILSCVSMTLNRDIYYTFYLSQSFRSDLFANNDSLRPFYFYLF